MHDHGLGLHLVDRNDLTFWEINGSRKMVIIQIGRTTGLPNGSTFVTGTNLTTGTWYHLAMVSDATPGTGSYRVYLNGVLNITSDWFSGETSSNLYFFVDDGGTLWLNGRMTSIKIYDAALTSTEINTEKASLDSCVRSSNLNTFLRANSSATAGTDSSGLGRNMTVAGTFTTEAGPP
jgi:hypothetical protein